MLTATNQIKLILFNARSVTNKWKDICNAINMHSAGIIAITETWLNAVKDSCVFSYLNYPKISAYRQHGEGGGVTILLHPTFNAIELPLPDNFPASCDCVIVNILPLKLILVLLYRPPHCTREDTVHLLSALENICNDHDHVTIMGDFDAPRIDWTTCPPTPLDAVAYDIIEFCEAMNMTQLVPKLTRDDSILDIILTTKPNRFSNCVIEAPIASFDHNSIVCYIKCPTSVRLIAIKKKSKNIDYVALNHEFAIIDWSSCFDNSLKISTVWNKF